MSRLPPMIAAILAGPLLCGCTSSPWSCGANVSAGKSTPEPARAAAATAPTSGQPDAQKMQQVMADVRRLGVSDPAGQQRLLDELRGSDPSLWPLMVQQFEATAAYRRRAAEQTAATVPPDRLPPVNNTAIAQVEPPPQEPPRTAVPPFGAPLPATSDPINPVLYASYAMPIPAGWQQQLAAAIEMLEADIARRPATPAEMAEHARLRMLYAAAGRREDAMRPIPAAPTSAQQFLSKELDGLTTWFDAARMPDAAARAAEVKPVMTEALVRLSELAPLVVRNVAFCNEVQSYGCIKRFDKYEFETNQEVLLYAEVENFASEAKDKGYHTALKSNYQVIDADGRCHVERALGTTEELCQNLRRDFFIGYRLRMSKDIKPGKYHLRLSIEDLKCHKAGHALVNFELKEAQKAEAKSN